ncbi:DUF2332 domain-containing protein [Microbacterium oxydans]|uniref:DUF2332 domain-containing protein n=1 Tax=Microbacterium TaxID=33882 RepID=UPI000DE395AE|nr:MULTISPECIES: DUF2332 domain-containing protein [unclassified Microbacterium]MBE7953691.1 DUF2332 domain-containing protein [Microbacterium sp. R1]NYF27399.1 hypothetical protein [Microbacterium sp. JAI119]RBO71921.1 DUF2332 domain-containing protein [Microbacterium sp. H6]
MTDAVQDRYARFARDEAPGRSALYAEWAAGVADDDELKGILQRIPENRRQPPLVFAVTRMLGSGLVGYPQWRDFVLRNADAVVAECANRSLQTNEPLRLAALLPVLSEIAGPIALLEVGASAGLCLYPDRYSYRFIAADGSVRSALDPLDGPSTVVLESRVSGALPPLRMPDVVWRAGVDLAPLDAADERDRRWLRGLVWPGEEGREERIDAALEIAASDPPLIVAGDALEEIDALAAAAPSGATLVVTTPGVLVHIPRARREALVARISALDARWVTIDPPGALDVWEPPVEGDDWPGFVVALDGRVRAAADPLGGWWEWRTASLSDAS